MLVFWEWSNLINPIYDRLHHCHVTSFRLFFPTICYLVTRWQWHFPIHGRYSTYGFKDGFKVLVCWRSSAAPLQADRRGRLQCQRCVLLPRPLLDAISSSVKLSKTMSSPKKSHDFFIVRPKAFIRDPKRDYKYPQIQQISASQMITEWHLFITHHPRDFFLSSEMNERDATCPIYTAIILPVIHKRN